MNTTEMIELLKSVEKGASGRSREISFEIPPALKDAYIHEPDITIGSTGDGCAGAELCLRIREE